jgi:magnesium transporter
MRVFHVHGDRSSSSTRCPTSLPAAGFSGSAAARREFEVQRGELQAALQALDRRHACRPACVGPAEQPAAQPLRLHIWYDLLVFRRLAAGTGTAGMFVDDTQGTLASARSAIEAIDTSPVGFAVFDRVLLTVHPTDCQVRDHFAGAWHCRASRANRGPVRACPAARPT